jgi:peptidoglycan/xylan/chitin deacetylase (PgdA/CDA1 family)
MKLALKVDVETLRGTREGVPALVDMLERHGAGATFFVSLGPDHSGRGLYHGLRSGIVSHYGVRTLLYGTLLPGPDIGRRMRAVLRSVRDAGFETGIHCYDVVRWMHGVAHADADWTAAEMQRAIDRFVDVFGEMPHAHGAAGWRTNRHALRLTQRLGFGYGSDGRGVGPHLPVWNGELVRCPQLPTTLPTLDELMAVGVEAGALAESILARTADAPGDQVFTLRAEIEGMKHAATLEALLLGWKAQGYELVSLGALCESIEAMALPRCEVGWGTVPGRAGMLLVQGEEFLADVELPRAA